MTINLNWVSEKFESLNDLAFLAKGGQKIVLSGNHQQHGNIVLKLIQKHKEERLDREIKATQLVDAIWVPTIHNKGTVETPMGEYIWILEQRIDGESLKTRLAKHKTLSFALALKLCDQILKTLALAEQQRIVHRDIKPDNIIVDINNNFWLIDFGIARHLDMDSLTETRREFGVFTLGYSAPEQVRNKKDKIDNRADLFSLGVVLYESLTGQNPFLQNAKDRFEVINRVERLQLPKLNLKEDIESSFSDFISTLIQKHPTQRQKNIQEAQDWFGEIKETLEGK
jgi:serine/threonine-protein kinase